MLAACSLGGLHRLPPCSSSLLCVASFCSVGFLFLVSFLDSTCWPFSPPFLLWLSLVLVARCFLGPFLPLEFHFAVWLVLRSLSGLLCSFGLAPFYFWIGRSFHLSRVFLLLLLGFSVAIPRSFLSCAFAFLSSSRMLLLGRGFGCPVLNSFMYF